MKSDSTSSLTDDQIATALHLCFKNAERLEIDASILEKNGSEERAIALLVLALEELAKIVLAFEALSIPPTTKAWEKFWRLWRNHSYKQSVWSHYGKLLEESNVRDAEAFSNRYPPGTDIDQVKQRGFYVSFIDGNFQSPAEFAKSHGDLLPWLRGLLGGRLNVFRELHGEIELSRSMVSNFRLLRSDPATWDEETKASVARVQSKLGHDFPTPFSRHNHALRSSRRGMR